MPQSGLTKILETPGHCCEVIFIRHGETDWNKAKRLQGREDIPLNATGRMQVKETGTNLRTILTDTPGTFTFDCVPTVPGNNILQATAIYTSPLSRAIESAYIIAETINYPTNEIIIEPSIIEWNAGKIQGLLFSELEKEYPEAWKAWRVKRDPNFVFPGGESFKERQDRVVRGVEQLVKNHTGQRIIVVCHAGVLDDIYRRAKHIPLQNTTRLPKLNAGIYVLHIPSDDTTHAKVPKWKILRWGLQKVTSRKESIEFETGDQFDPTSIVYA